MSVPASHSSTAASAAEADAARLLLARLGLSPEDLLTTPADRPAAPMFADYIPIVSAAVTDGTRRVYGSYWNRILRYWGERWLDEPTPSEIKELVTRIRSDVVPRRNARGGRGAGEHLIAALRCLYRHAEDDGLITRADNPALKVAKPRRLPTTRRAVADTRLAEINHTAATTGNDPALGTLLLRLHIETACRRGGALAFRPQDLDPTQCLISLREKGESTRWQPIFPTLMTHLQQHACERHAPPEKQLLRYADGRPITTRRYDHLWTRLGRHLAWVATQQISTHWLRHTTLSGPGAAPVHRPSKSSHRCPSHHRELPQVCAFRPSPVGGPEVTITPRTATGGFTMRQHGQRAGSVERKAQGEERDEVAGRSLVTPAGPIAPEAVLAMQRLVGNAAVVQRLARHEHADGCCGSGETVQRNAVARSLGSPGRPLDDDVRSEMEGRIGHDFSDVRIHTDATAHAAAESVQAHAFTTGSDIVFQRSQYDPATVPGKKRLAHELLHVVQQRQGPVEGTDNGRGAKVSDPSDRFERAASAGAEQVMAGAAPAQRAAVDEWEAATAPAQGAAAAHAGDVQVQRVELVDALDTMRNRPLFPNQEEGMTSIRRGAEDESLGLPPELLDQLERLVQQDQPVASTVDKGDPQRKSSSFGGGNAVNVTHEVGFDVKGQDAKNLRYIRFVKAAKINQGLNRSWVKRQRTVSGYVSWSSAVETPDMGKGTDDDVAYQARLVTLLDEDFAAAKWSYDGPSKEFYHEEKEGEEVVRLINVDTPGVTSDFMQYPIVQRYEFYGVLYDAARRAILNVSHYSDRLIGLSETAALSR